MKSKYIVAIVAAGLIGSSMAAYGPAPKATKGCGFDSSRTSNVDKFGNAFQSGAKSRVCWSDRIAFGGEAQARYTYTNNDTLKAESVSLNNDLKLNHVALTIDALLDSKWTAHMTVADMYLADGTNDFRFDEAMLYYNDASTPFGFKAGYGFSNFGEYGNNVYSFLRNPTDVAATNQDTQVGVSFSEDGMFGEFYAIGENNIGWGAAIGYDNQVGEIGIHSKLAYISNKDMSGIVAANGGTLDLDIVAALPMGTKVGFSYIKSRGVQAGLDPLKMWSVDAAYRFSAGGMPSNLHGWYANNTKTGANALVTDLDGETAGLTGDRFNLMQYNTSLLDNIWSVGYGVEVAPNVDVSLDYVNSSGTDVSGGDTRGEVSNFTMVNLALTGRF